MKTRVQVISQKGRLVGVYIPPTTPSPDPNAPIAYIRAGPGQVVNEISVELSTALPRTRKRIDALHAEVRKKLKLRK
jgi:hypothetical protein